ncbi:uncharacterized protein LOC123525921 isoform X2 [Mercenaria mercenaria]|uniref:uncharacterized protein LOC123525921 isoform X2 n=1 Tax=Mercenaria mercenaria TaxID=6596 RepID=UPI00234E83B6|nr:uncharacterized protein LOC123525921 isoform X2 [Mercenaria mercenaria]
MTLKYSIEPSGYCKPYSRTKLYKEIFEFGTCGEIHEVWLSARHLFVNLDGGKQLYTFDCKTVEQIQDAESSGCLDLCDDFPVQQVLLKPPHAAFVIFRNGITQYWIYKSDHIWKQQTTHRLCHGSLAMVVDVCYNVSQNALYWCQRQESEIDGKVSFMIYKRQIVEGEEEDKQTLLKLGPASLIIKDCPKCTVYPMAHGIVFVSENSSTQALFVVRVSTSSGQVDILVEKEWITVTDVIVHTPVQFSKIVMKSLQHLNKLKSLSVIKTSYIPQTQTLHLLYSSGNLCTILHSLDTSVNVVQLEGFSREGLIGICSQSDTVGLAYKQCIQHYSVKTGALLCSIEIPYGSVVLGVGGTLFGGVQQAVYTDDNLYMLQKCAESKNVSEMSLLELSHFQSDAVRLSYVDKMQKYTVRSPGELSHESLKKKWIENLGTPPTSRLVETVEPFLTQYWKLENLLHEGLQEPCKISQLKPDTIEEEVNHLLDPKSPLSRQARQSQLVLLAQFCPVEVLNCLMSYLKISGGEMSTSQQQKWQCALTQETCNVAGSCDIAVPLFELMCHLLYKHKPEKLVQFVHHGQKVWDQKVGMSAFVRRRQIPFIYERALKCIPQPEHSTDPGTAILAHVHILLTSEIDGCFTKGLHLLLRAEKWEETIELLKEYKDRCPQFALLYQMTLAALTKKQVLPLYAGKIFSLMPSFKCTTDVIQGSPGDADTPVLCESTEDVSVDSVRPCLLGCLNKLNINNV